MTPRGDPTDDDPRVLSCARDYLAELEAGRTPDRNAFIARHPDLAPALADYFDGIDLAHAAGQALRPTASAPVSEYPTEPLGDFKIVRELGRGGMGVVYEAVQLSLGRRVALKVLPFAAALNPRQLQRFKTEAHAAAQLHHTNIVPVYAVGCERGVHFYAMQVIDGRPLDVVIHELRGDMPPKPTGGSTVDFLQGSTAGSKPPLSVTTSRAGRGRDVYRTAAKFARQVAEALEYAHDAGVIHRDIKPANLLLDARGTVWVTDFGLAQVAADVGMTQTGDVFGTLRYMSPEQASGRRVDVDHRADVYSLGATLYELLALEPIFPGHDRAALLQQILNEEPRRPRLLDRGIPIELETIVLKAVAKIPAERYSTAGEMAADLRRFLDDRPILARRPTLIDRARKWVRRHPEFLAGAILLLATGAVGFGVTTAVVVRERDRTTAALAQERIRASEADERFRLARRAVDQMIQLGEEELADDPRLQGLRKRMLEAAVAYYQEFIEQRQDDPTAQADLAVTRDKVKTILGDLAVLQGAGDLFLLAEPAVHEDLKLTSDQRDKVNDHLRRLADQRPEMFSDFHKLSADDRRQRFLELTRKNESAIAAILSPLQIRRLHQIAIHVKGPSAFLDPDLAMPLKLTPEQRDQIRGIEAESFFSRFDAPRVGPPGSGFRKGPDRGSKAAVDKILALLSPEQGTKWRELTGAPFSIGRPLPFPGPRPREQ